MSRQDIEGMNYTVKERGNGSYEVYDVSGNLVASGNGFREANLSKLAKTLPDLSVDNESIYADEDITNNGHLVEEEMKIIQEQSHSRKKDGFLGLFNFRSPDEPEEFIVKNSSGDTISVYENIEDAEKHKALIDAYIEKYANGADDGQRESIVRSLVIDIGGSDEFKQIVMGRGEPKQMKSLEEHLKMTITRVEKIRSEGVPAKPDHSGRPASDYLLEERYTVTTKKGFFGGITYIIKDNETGNVKYTKDRNQALTKVGENVRRGEVKSSQNRKSVKRDFNTYRKKSRLPDEGVFVADEISDFVSEVYGVDSITHIADSVIDDIVDNVIETGKVVTGNLVADAKLERDITNTQVTVDDIEMARRIMGIK